MEDPRKGSVASHATAGARRARAESVSDRRLMGDRRTVPPFDDRVLRDKLQGALVGALVGDCFGASFEGHPGPVAPAEIAQVERSAASLRYSANMAMTIALAESLLFRGDLDDDHVAETLAVQFEREPDRGYGPQVADLLRKIHAGGDWRKAARAQFGGQGSLGNAAAARVAPVAMFAPTMTNEMLEFARRSAQVTHTHPSGVDGARVQASAIAIALNEGSTLPLRPSSVLHELVAIAETYPLARQLERLNDLRVDASPTEANRWIGTSSAARDSVPAALWAALRSCGSFENTIRFAIGLGGDPSPVASMAGAICGAHLGVRAIPERWICRVEGSDAAMDLADRFLRHAGNRDRGRSDRANSFRALPVPGSAASVDRARSGSVDEGVG